MSKYKTAWRTFGAAYPSTFKNLYEVLGQYLDLSTLTGEQIGQILNFGADQYRVGYGAAL